MFSFFQRFRSPPPPEFSAEIAPQESFFAIGDIHGRADLLDRLLKHMDDHDTGIPRVFVGDYIDRGEESAEVLRCLQALEAEDPRVTCLTGNHEAMLLETLSNPARSGARWLRHGGLQTLASYGVGPVFANGSDEEWNRMSDQLRAAMGDDMEAWLRRLPLSWTSGNVTVLHAGADPTLPIEEQDPNTLIWGHPDFDALPRQDGRWVVHGHTIVDVAQVGMGRISIDTGAYATGHLTAALISPGEVRFLKA